MAKKYKYRHKELYKDTVIDIKADTLSTLMKKLQEKKNQADHMYLDPNMKLAIFVQRWLDTYKRNSVSESWFREICRISRTMTESIGNKPVGKIKPLNVQEYLNTCTKYTDSYIKKIYDITCQIFKYAYKNGLTSHDFTLDLERPRGRDSKTGRSITKKERDTLLAVLNGNGKPHRGNLFFKFMLYCGLRPGEACALLWKDVDLKNGFIDVNKAQKKDGSIGSPKSESGIRKIPLPGHFVNELKQFKGSPFDLVCPQTNGKAQTETTLKNMWRNVKRLMNIEMGCKVFRNQLIPPLPLAEDFTMYNLRHTYCTDLEKMGVPINIARQLMGHSSIEITSRIYTHASEESLDIAKRLINMSGNHNGIIM